MSTTNGLSPLAGDSAPLLGIELQVYGTNNKETSVASVTETKKKTCTKKRCSLSAALVTVILLLGGGLYGLTRVPDPCKTISCDAGESPLKGRLCQCLDESQYVRYKNGTYPCNPC